MAEIKLENIIKVYDKKIKAVDEVSLHIKDKEFMVFVGPSGCGKSTLLRMIAGLEDITYGKLYIDDVLSNAILPKDRDIAMVFQSYALYPTMTVYDNIAFGIKARKLDNKEVDKRVREAAELLGLTQYLNRKPLTLSGGQRQRVALGRALVRDAKVFLLDEPLSNLDAKLRGQMRTVISSLHKKIEKTFIYVTHDQVEAMTMADRIAVINEGKIQQVGTPREIFDTPANVFVASFIGLPSMNLINCIYKNNNIDGLDLSINYDKLNDYEEKEIILGVRPNDVKIINTNGKFEITYVELLGAEQNVHVLFNNQTLIIQTKANVDYKVGQKVDIELNTDRLSFFDVTTQNRI